MLELIKQRMFEMSFRQYFFIYPRQDEGGRTGIFTFQLTVGSLLCYLNSTL